MTASAQKTAPAQGESIQFAAEISKVLQLMIHSLYTNKDIFLRELVSNASDACDKLRYLAVQDDGLLADDKDLKISVSFDAKEQTLSISDNGIGMNRDDLIANLGTIAKSGTQEFFGQMTGDAKKDMSLIGQFGVGFYASFMVADKVEVHTRKAGSGEESWRWVSDGQGSFEIEPAAMRARGTTITLHLKKEAKDYLDAFKLKFIIQTYSDHISFPIDVTDAEGRTELVNEGSAIWARSKSDVTDEQYEEFYHHVAHSPDKPFMVLHNKAEGTLEYTNLLFIPSMKPFDLFHPERRRRVKLYVKRVFITDEGIDLVPQYMRFLRGVVDSQDLPLNISRETLQDNPLLGKIRDAITKKVLSELLKKAKKEPEAYAQFWEHFGAVLKEGLCEPASPKDKILEVCRFASSESDMLVSLDEYIERMSPDQQAIYYLNADSLEAARRSAQLEGFAKRGIEVLLLTDHVDDFWVGVNPEYKGKKFKSVVRAGEDLNDLSPKDAAAEADAEPAQTEAMDALISRLKGLFAGEIRDVRITQKLDQSPVCLAVGEGDMDLRMERFLMEHKQLPRGSAKILEINPRHPVIVGLAAQLAADAAAPVDDAAYLLLDLARIQEGEPVRDVADFAKRLNQLMVSSLPVA